MQLMGTALRKKNALLVGRLYQAYVALMLAPEGKDGSRTVSLVRYGSFEVRLTEFSNRRTVDASAFWIELYRHDTRSSLDGCHFEDLLDAETVVEQFMSRARSLHDSHDGSPLSISSSAPSAST
jgi:hypothetical protein